MPEADPVTLRQKAAHYRQLAGEINDRHTAESLSRRADELELEAAALEKSDQPTG